MEAIKKQASRLREQVAKQQQAILRQLGQLGHEAVMVDDTELECYEQLQNLYKSTRTAKHFQRDIVRGVEGFISASKKQMEITRKLAEDCCKYGIENQSDALHLARAASGFGTSHVSMEDHRETMVGILANQKASPSSILLTPKSVSNITPPQARASPQTQIWDRFVETRLEVPKWFLKMANHPIEPKLPRHPDSDGSGEYGE